MKPVKDEEKEGEEKQKELQDQEPIEVEGAINFKMDFVPMRIAENGKIDYDLKVHPEVSPHRYLVSLVMTRSLIDNRIREIKGEDQGEEKKKMSKEEKEEVRDLRKVHHKLSNLMNELSRIVLDLTTKQMEEQQSAGIDTNDIVDLTPKSEDFNGLKKKADSGDKNLEYMAKDLYSNGTPVMIDRPPKEPGNEDPCESIRKIFIDAGYKYYANDIMTPEGKLPEKYKQQ